MTRANGNLITSRGPIDVIDGGVPSGNPLRDQRNKCACAYRRLLFMMRVRPYVLSDSFMFLQR